MLRLLDFEKPFEVNTDALDKAVGETSLKRGTKIAFEIQKLKDAKQQYTAH